MAPRVWYQWFQAKRFSERTIQVWIDKKGVLRSGDILFCIIGRKYQQVNEWTPIIIDSIIWYYEYVLEPTLKDGQKIVMFFDTTNCGWNQTDTRLILNGAPILINYYPGVVSKVYLYHFPWFLKSIFNIFISLLPPKFHSVIYFVDEGNIASVMGGEKYVPDFLGGSLKTNDPKLPDGMSTIEGVGVRCGIKRRNIQKFYTMINTGYELK